MKAAIVQPRLGFLGVGWIGRHRLAALAESGVARVAAIADPIGTNATAAAELAPDAAVVSSLDELLDAGLDGVVIATPSALHAEQAIAALERGLAVFCQKPLGRTAEETSRVIEAARAADRLLGVDLSYRHVEGAQRLRELIRGGELGRIYAADLVFHNAHGPDKPWYYTPQLAGGGCVVDLGIHLVDLALWMLDGRRVTQVTSRLFANGEPLRANGAPLGANGEPLGANGEPLDGARSDWGDRVEDYAVAQLDLDGGEVVRLACSWNLPAGRDAIIEASFFGTAGGASLRNVDGSFYDFTAERFQGTRRDCLCGPPDAWGGRALVAWAERLARGERFDAGIERLVDVAAVLDAMYGRPPTALVAAVTAPASVVGRASVPAHS